MQKIDDLQLEIKSFETEIQKLQAELTAVGGFTMKLATSTAPSEIAKSIRTEAQQVLERQPALKGLRDAIAELTSRLKQKQVQLQKLQVVELKEARKERVENAKQKLREQFERVDDIASLLESAYYDLKAIYKEANPDFKALGSAEPGSYSYQIHQLINFDFLQVPVLVEKSGAFTLGSRTINLFEAEQKAVKDEQTARSRDYRLEREQEWAEAKQQKKDEEARIELEDRAALLKYKQSEVAGAKAERKRLLDSLATMNVSGFDRVIFQLEAEIENLKKPVQP
jgi:DNA repair exonuclease SbcCD ATPase subunit